MSDNNCVGHQLKEVSVLALADGVLREIVARRDEGVVSLVSGPPEIKVGFVHGGGSGWKVPGGLWGFARGGEEVRGRRIGGLSGGGEVV